MSPYSKRGRRSRKSLETVNAGSKDGTQCDSSPSVDEQPAASIRLTRSSATKKRANASGNNSPSPKPIITKSRKRLQAAKKPDPVSKLAAKSNLQSGKSSLPKANETQNGKSAKKEVKVPKHVPKDPITLQKLGRHTWAFEYSFKETDEKPQHVFKAVYNVGSLVEYLLQTGKFLEPTTRIPFTSEQVESLEMAAKKAKLKGSDRLLKAFKTCNDPDSIYTIKNDKRKFLEAYEVCTGKCISGIRDAIDHVDAKKGKKMLLEQFEEFEGYFWMLWSVDKEFCSHCITTYKYVLRGPPNNETSDKDGRLTLAMNLLNNIFARNSSRIF